MAEEKDLKRAQEVFAALCGAMDAEGWQYKKDESKLRLECTVQGEDLSIEINMTVDAERELIILFSRIPLAVPGDKRLEMAIAVSAVNNKLVDGCFDYDIQSGDMFFRLTNSYLDSTIGAEAFLYMVVCGARSIDEYNDKFLMIAKGMTSLDDFLKGEIDR